MGFSAILALALASCSRITPGAAGDAGAAASPPAPPPRVLPALDAYHDVDEVAAAPDDYLGRAGLKLHGSVVAGSIDERVTSGRVERRFTLEHGGATIVVTSGAPVPDTFRDYAEVVATGTLRRDGAALRLDAADIIAKCPAGYKPPG